jgi:SAM-dependent methyltransferase
MQQQVCSELGLGSTPEDLASRDAAWNRWARLSAAGKFTMAWRGTRALLGELGRRGAFGRVAAVALAPLALLYVAGSVLRDSLVYGDGAIPARRPIERRAYLRHRYGRTQWVVNWREQRLVASFLAHVGTPERVLDAPSGYGRFVAALARVSRQSLVCTDIDQPRLASLRAAPDCRGVSAVRSDLQGALPFATGAFDLVFNLRYLHHTHTKGEQRVALAELVRVSRRFVLVSYYRRSNLHALQRAIQEVARTNRRRGPAMIDRRDFDRMVRAMGCRVVRDRPLLPWIHAQRVVLLEQTGVRPDPR